MGGRQPPAGFIEAAQACAHGAERVAVIREAYEWIDTPWRHQCRQKGLAVDCGNLIAGVYTNCGLIESLPLYEYAHDHYLHSSEERFRGILEQFCVRVSAALPGDILGYRIGKLEVSHGAILVGHTGWPVIIHAYKPKELVTLDDELARLSQMRSSIWRPQRWA